MEKEKISPKIKIKEPWYKKAFSNILSAGFLLSIVTCLSYAFAKLSLNSGAFAGCFILLGFLAIICLLLMVFFILKQISEIEIQKLKRETDDLESSLVELSGSITMVDSEGNSIDEHFENKEQYDAIIRKYLGSHKFGSFLGMNKNVKLKEKPTKSLNDLNEKELEDMKRDAITNENFELAAKIRVELEKRKPENK